MGALAMHQKAEHASQIIHQRLVQKRLCYSLSFKAKAVALAEELLALRCTQCNTKQSPELIERMRTDEEREAKDGDELHCTGCGHTCFERGARFQ